MKKVEKLVRNGKVAVLYSSVYGYGWSTMAAPEEKSILLFHPKLVKWVLQKKKKKKIEDIFRELGLISNSCDANDVEVVWLPVGTRFRISEP